MNRHSSNNILFIQPLYYDPTLPNFKDRFELLSKSFGGTIISSSDKKFDGLKFGRFTYRALPFIGFKLLRYPLYFFEIIHISREAFRTEGFGYVHVYDPLILGFYGVVIKKLFRAKLIVEANGHLRTAGFLKTGGMLSRLKHAVYNYLIRFSIRNADIVKFLNEDQAKELVDLLENKKMTVFPDFVPTNAFNPEASREGDDILFLGYPFYLKGVDILIKAFIRISGEFPEARLKIVGYCPGGDAEREEYRQMTEGNSRIEISEPVFYKEAVQLIQNCLFLVLPSRTEAMGRVLIEAMAAGKAVIGSRVGGIPDVISDGRNGLLFRAGDIDDLSRKLKTLLADRPLRERMGRQSLSVVSEKFTPEIYLQHFEKLVMETETA